MSTMIDQSTVTELKWHNSPLTFKNSTPLLSLIYFAMHINQQLKLLKDFNFSRFLSMFGIEEQNLNVHSMNY